MSWDEALGCFDDMVADEPPLRHVLVPPHRPAAHQAQHPPRRRRLRGRARSSRVRGWVDDELLVQHASSGCSRRRQQRPGVIPAMNQVSRTRAVGRGPTATSPTASSRRRGGSSSARWSTPSRARPGSTPSREARTLIERRAGGSPSRSRSASPLPTTSRSRPLTGVTRSTSPSTWTALATTGPYFAAMEQVMRVYAGRPHWGKLHTRDGCRPRAGVPPLRRLPAVRDRLDPTGCSATPTWSGCSADVGRA